MNSIHNSPVSQSPKKSNKIWIFVVVSLLILCCCCLVIGTTVGYFVYQNSDEEISINFGDNLFPEEESQQDSTKPQEKSTQKPLIQIPDLSGVKMGEEVRVENCGFSFKKVPDFQYNSAEMEGWGFCSSPSMIAPGGDNKVGPIIIMVDDAGENAQTKYDEMIEKYKNDDTVISQKPTKIGNVDGISVVGETKVEDNTIKSMTVFALVSPNQFFQIIALAPSEKWEELLPYFEGVMKSITFFEPVQSSTSGDESSKEIRNEEGGYAFKTIPDYELTINNIIPGHIFMDAKDKVVVKIGAKDGPKISLFGQLSTKDVSIDAYAKSYNDSIIRDEKATISDEQEITIAGQTGKAFDFVYEIPEIGKIRARAIFVEVKPRQFFLIECYSPEEKWDKTLVDFNLVIDSLTFFDAKPKK